MITWKAPPVACQPLTCEACVGPLGSTPCGPTLAASHPRPSLGTAHRTAHQPFRLPSDHFNSRSSRHPHDTWKGTGGRTPGGPHTQTRPKTRRCVHPTHAPPLPASLTSPRHLLPLPLPTPSLLSSHNPPSAPRDNRPILALASASAWRLCHPSHKRNEAALCPRPRRFAHAPCTMHLRSPASP